MNSYDRLYEMLIEGAVKASNKAKKREWVRRKGLKDTGEPSYRAIISTRKAARHGQDVAAATVVAGREALKTEGAISTEVKETPGSNMMLARSQIGQGLYSKFSTDPSVRRKHGREAAKLIAQARQARQARKEQGLTR